MPQGALIVEVSEEFAELLVLQFEPCLAKQVVETLGCTQLG